MWWLVNLEISLDLCARMVADSWVTARSANDFGFGVFVTNSLIKATLAYTDWSYCSKFWQFTFNPLICLSSDAISLIAWSVSFITSPNFVPLRTKHTSFPWIIFGMKFFDACTQIWHSNQEFWVRHHIICQQLCCIHFQQEAHVFDDRALLLPGVVIHLVRYCQCTHEGYSLWSYDWAFWLYFNVVCRFLLRRGDLWKTNYHFWSQWWHKIPYQNCYHWKAQ